MPPAHPVPTPSPVPDPLTLGHSPVVSPSHFEEKWRLVQQKMPLENADRLLKNAGFRGRYLEVTLAIGFEEPHSFRVPLRWIFNWIEIPGRPITESFVVVEVLTGKVYLLGQTEMKGFGSRYGELSLGALGSGSGASCMIETS